MRKLIELLKVLWELVGTIFFLTECVSTLPTKLSPQSSVPFFLSLIYFGDGSESTGKVVRIDLSIDLLLANVQ